MAFDSLMAQIGLLMTEMENQPEDPHEIYMLLHEKLNEMKALGAPLPDELVELEKQLSKELIDTSKA